MGKELPINWNYFSLVQINSREGPEWKVWEQTDEATSNGLNPFRAAEAARRQGDTVFKKYHQALLNARHKDNADISDADLLARLATDTGADVEQFKKDFGDAGILERLARDHTNAVETYRAFGTPTLVFGGDKPVYLKIRPLEEEDSLKVFNEVRAIAEGRPNVLEIKRP